MDARAAVSPSPLLSASTMATCSLCVAVMLSASNSGLRNSASYSSQSGKAFETTAYSLTSRSFLVASAMAEWNSRLNFLETDISLSELCLFISRIALSKPATCSRVMCLAASRAMTASSTSLKPYASTTSFVDISRTRTPRYGTRSASPAETSRSSPSRTGVMLTPSCVAMSSCRSQSPGLYLPEMIFSCRTSKISSLRGLFWMLSVSSVNGGWMDNRTPCDYPRL